VRRWSMRSVGPEGVTARVPSGQQRNKLRGRDACRTEVTSRSHKEQGESLVRKFEQELAELTEACTALFFEGAADATYPSTSAAARMLWAWRRPVPPGWRL